MQVIEKVKVVPEGYNGAGMNYDLTKKWNCLKLLKKLVKLILI